MAACRVPAKKGFQFAAVSPEMALRIEKAFGVNMDTLLKMQAWFDACLRMRDRAHQIVVKRYVPESRTRG
jgi:antitoxin HigA-1